MMTSCEAEKLNRFCPGLAQAAQGYCGTRYHPDGRQLTGPARQVATAPEQQRLHPRNIGQGQAVDIHAPVSGDRRR